MRVVDDIKRDLDRKTVVNGVAVFVLGSAALGGLVFLLRKAGAGKAAAVIK